VRLSKQQSAANRQRTLRSAARLFRTKGVNGVGMEALAEAAGVTQGSLYSQFGSKDALVTEAVAEAFVEFREKLGSIADFEGYVKAYLSPEHRDSVGDGCAVSTLGTDAARQGATARDAFTAGTRSSLDRLTALQPVSRADRRKRAVVTMATLAGAMILARAVDDPALSEEILEANRDHLVAAFGKRRNGESTPAPQAKWRL